MAHVQKRIFLFTLHMKKVDIFGMLEYVVIDHSINPE